MLSVLAKTPAVVDGNKRAAFLSTGLFLAINGYRLKADQVDAIQTILAVAARELDEQGLAAWMTEKVVSCIGNGSVGGLHPCRLTLAEQRARDLTGIHRSKQSELLVLRFADAVDLARHRNRRGAPAWCESE